MFDFRVLADWSYYFDPRPTSGMFDWLIPLIAFFGLMLVAAVYCKLVFGFYRKDKPHDRELGERLFSWLITISIIGFIYTFFRYEGIVYLSARIVLILILIGGTYWGWLVWKFYRTKFGQIKDNFHKKKEQKRYMPKKRKK
ncbi:hypothetical protein KJ855_03250 [Patescibacteria group bacterium]|nr:hypothetical protein [Patescibacteria group bacterium]